MRWGLDGLLKRAAGVLWREAPGARVLRRDVRRAQARLDEMETRLREVEARARSADRLAAQLRLEGTVSPAHREALSGLPAVLDEARIGAHVRQAIDAASLLGSPCDHLVVPSILPDDVYALLLQALPPEVFFDDRDPIKQNLFFPMAAGPTLITRVWNFMDGVIAGRLIREAVLDRLHEPLQRHFDVIFGEPFRREADALPQFTDGGRLMLRRPGYHLRPHRDPKRAMITCLLYLARPGDSEAYGTQLFRVAPDDESRYKQTYYPEADGHVCELDTTVPFKPNTLLALLNSRGAHGAAIPADAPAGIERYAYQFYVAPENTALAALIKPLPPERRAMWKRRDLPSGWWKERDRPGATAPRADHASEGSARRTTPSTCSTTASTGMPVVST